MEQVFFNVPLSKLEPVFKGWVRDCLNERTVEEQTTPEIIDGDELIKKLGITRQTLLRWRKQNRIPYVQAGSVIRYDLNKVIKALENKKGGAR
ncbi:helix-turn-helix domain-containing protein [Parapedobacter soli]|uniref:helix-turn-helix domain-containing protein n=1 Tax=Parapedobacter soli TaxID=416955 RepID=UPI0021C6202B|nr:helix-turn-helix domain-containing protein [Parapedobacter soli]